MLDSVTPARYGVHLVTDSAFERETEQLAQARADEVAKYDRTVLSLATGVLALSATLVRDDAGDLVWPVLLLVGWLALLASMFLIVWSFTIAKRSFESRHYNKPEHETQALSLRAWSKSVQAGWALVGGSVLLIVFVWLNVQ